MIKKHWKQIVLSSVVVLLPLIAGLLLWNKLPDMIATHFDAAGVADGWSSKAFAVFGMPCFMLLVHLVAICATLADPKWNNIKENGFSLVMWLLPALSLFVGILTYASALNQEINVTSFVYVFVGLVLTIVGGFLPHCKQNYTIGIKLPWTLHDEENWDKTHKLAGKVWMAGGVLFIICSLISLPQLGFAAVAAAVLIPTVYSYLLYRKKNLSE